MTKRLINLTGQRFSRLLVQKRESVVGEKRAHWLCVCDCGKTCVANGSSLRNGSIKSCGCLQEEARCQFRHGQAKIGALSREYKTWARMKSRCENKNSKAYPLYGGRGIKVCERWHDFLEFYKDMGTRLEGMSIDRIDPNGDYEPGNCRWATSKQQNRNRTNNRVVTFNGVTASLAEICELNGARYSAVHARLQRGLTIDNAIALTIEALNA